jgi:hypothetical protein
MSQVEPSTTSVNGRPRKLEGNGGGKMRRGEHKKSEWGPSSWGGGYEEKYVKSRKNALRFLYYTAAPRS